MVVSYQAWDNGKITTASQARAKEHACDLDSSCIVLDDSPKLGKANAIKHEYEFSTTHGIMTVTCRRQLIFFGAWDCVPAEGRMVDEPW